MRLTERFLGDDSAVVRRVVDNGRLNEVSFGLGNVGFTSGKGVTLGLGVCKETLDTLVLHGVLDGTEHDTVVIGRADLEVRGGFGHGSQHFFIDLFVDIDALGGYTDL